MTAPANPDPAADNAAGSGSVRRLVGLCERLVAVIEGPETFRDEAGRRLRDTPEWAEFYSATKAQAGAPTIRDADKGRIRQAILIADDVIDDRMHAETRLAEPSLTNLIRWKNLRKAWARILREL